MLLKGPVPSWKSRSFFLVVTAKQSLLISCLMAYPEGDWSSQEDAYRVPELPPQAYTRNSVLLRILDYLGRLYFFRDDFVGAQHY